MQLAMISDDLSLEELRKKDSLTVEETARLVMLEDADRKRILSGLARKIEDNWVQRANDRTSKEQEWIKAGDLYNSPLVNAGPANPDDPFKTKHNKTRPTPNIVRTKCDTAVSISYSMQFAAGTKNWDLFPPANNQSPEVSEACILMEREIDSQLDACNYSSHARRAMEDRVIYGTGILKGPVNTGKRKVEYVNEGGVWVSRVSTDYTPTIVHVSPWRFYPDMSVVEFNECSDVIETHSMSPIELSQYKTHPGFDGDAIRDILTDEQCSPELANIGITKLKEDVWNLNPYLYKKKKYVVLEYHGPVTYDELNAMGIEADYKEGDVQEFFGEVWVCAGRVIRMEIENIEGYSETPYAVAIWKRDPGSIFGFGHPLLLADPQRVVTQAYHMILDNAALTSGPQVAMYKKYVQPVDGKWELHPNKVWHLTDPSKSIHDSIQFFNPTNVIGQIMPVLQLAMQFGEEESATTATAAGLNSPQNADSATGQLIMQHASTTLLDFQSEDWDDEITEKVIRRFYAWNMQFSQREDIKGNYTIDVKSSSEYKNKQMYVRDLERLSMETAQNPALADVVNMDALTRSRLALMHLPDNRIVRTPEETQQIQEQKQNQPDPAMIELQLKEREIAVKEQELALRAQNLQFEQTMVQRREEMDYQEKMGSNQARLMEAQARVLEVQGNERIELLKLAQKGEMQQQQLAALMKQSMDQNESRVFIASMQEASKARQQNLVQQELNVKVDQGSGI